MTEDEFLWLVIFDPPSGIAEICNVGVFAAADAKDATGRAAEAWHLIPGEMHAFQVPDLTDGWSYYQ